MATITAASVRTAVQTAVEAHGTHNNWYSIWSAAKDRDSVLAYPAVCWDQWTSKHPEDVSGFLQHQQLVTLVICQSVDSDRTPAERDSAVEACHAAAMDIIQELRTNADFTVGNIACTSQFDEFGALETGVVLLFTVTGSASC